MRLSDAPTTERIFAVFLGLTIGFTMVAVSYPPFTTLFKWLAVFAGESAVLILVYVLIFKRDI